MTFYVYAIKATRRPIFVDQQVDMQRAQLVAATAYQVTQLLFSAKLASSGISYQIFDTELPSTPGLPSVPPLYQVGAV